MKVGDTNYSCWGGEERRGEERRGEEKIRRGEESRRWRESSKRKTCSLCSFLHFASSLFRSDCRIWPRAEAAVDIFEKHRGRKHTPEAAVAISARSGSTHIHAHTHKHTHTHTHTHTQTHKHTHTHTHTHTHAYAHTHTYTSTTHQYCRTLFCDSCWKIVQGIQMQPSLFAWQENVKIAHGHYIAKLSVRDPGSTVKLYFENPQPPHLPCKNHTHTHKSTHTHKNTHTHTHTHTHTRNL